MAMVKHIFLMSATARGFLAARPFVRDNCAKRAVFAGGGQFNGLPSAADRLKG